MLSYIMPLSFVRRGKVVFYITAGTGCLVAYVYWSHLEEAPITGRSRCMLFDLADEIALGEASAQMLLAQLVFTE